MNKNAQHPAASADYQPDANRSVFRFPSPQAAMEFTGERFVSGLDGQIKHEHYHRYLYATRYCVGKDVLDIASGEGYGSVLLGQVARRVIGVDIDKASVDYANKTYLSNDVSFKQGSASDLPIATGSIDVVVSFETIEHFAEQDRFLEQVVRVLKPDGLLVISSPNKVIYDSQNADPNPFHVHELDADEFVDLLRGHFAHVAVFGQRALHGSVILPTDRRTDAAFETLESDDGLQFVREVGLANMTYSVAVASAVPLPDPRASLLHNSALVPGLQAALWQSTRKAVEAEARIVADAARRDEEMARAIGLRDEKLAQAAARYAEERDRAVRGREELSATINTLRSELAGLNDRLASRSEQLRAARAHIGQIITSTSWRFSGPIRAVGNLREHPRRTLREGLRMAWWAVTLNLRIRMRERRQMRLLYTVGGFDPIFYLRRYPDVAATGIDPALHYLRSGAAEGRDPSSDFSTATYRARHPELAADANPLVDAITTGRLADGEISHLDAPGPPTTGLPLLSLDLSGLIYHEHENPEVAIIVDARLRTPAVDHSLRVISAEADKLPGELFILVAPGSDFAFAGARRVIAGSGNAFAYIEMALAQTAAPTVIFIDSDTAVETGALAVGLSTLAESDDVAVVCGLRRGAAGTIEDVGLGLGADGQLHARGAGLPIGHYAVASVAAVDAFTPGFFGFKKLAWQDVAGTSSEFQTPAYAAADLSMRLRAGGKRVLCQPTMQAQVLATAAHSHAAPTEDRKVLLKHWATTIEHATHHPTPRILLVEHFTPTPDRDAGSNVVWWYMRIFQDLGYRVTFLPATAFARIETYTSNLQQQGIECVYPPGAASVQQYLRDNAAGFQIIMLYRVAIATQYIDLLRQAAPLAKIIFNTQDLHFLREEREALLLGSAERLKAAQETKQTELAAVRKSDCTIVLSKFEHALLQQLAPKANTQFIPITQPVPGSAAPFEERNGIVFVGGFSHQPNVDAVAYLVRDIWPLIHAELPDVRLIIVGSGMTNEVRSFGDAAAGIEIRGFVADLAGLLGACRLTVAPLRYGAGMKGKVVNSLAHGVPCVTTTIGVEGTGLRPDHDILVADDPSSYARLVVAAYTDRDMWERLSSNGVTFAQENFSLETVTGKIKDMLHTLGL